ncbi:MAG: copper resistance CopC family protein [Casimicrobiaceae bacterium]
MRAILIIVTVAAVSFFPGCVEAHTFLDRASPAVGSVVHVAPTQLRLWFSETLEPAFSMVEVVDADGKRVDKDDQRLDPNDKSLLEVSLPVLPPGEYRVHWRALSVDTHVTEGHFTFTVLP